MLELLLLRHAKALADPRGQGDEGRDLEPEGAQAAARVGELLRTEGLIPDLALCSTATRALRTWELAREAIEAEVPTRPTPGLYLASPAAILALVRKEAQTPRRLLLVGHNPGLHAFARRMVGSNEGARELALEFPTAGLARIGVEAGSWSEVAAGRGRLLGYWRPTGTG